MPNENVTIRHAKHALGLILSGALRDLEAHFAPDSDELHEATTTLFDEMADTLSDWEIPGTQMGRLDAMLGEMQNDAIAEGAKGREVVLELLVKHELLP